MKMICSRKISSLLISNIGKSVKIFNKPKISKYLTTLGVFNDVPRRFKFNEYKGVKGIRNRKFDSGKVLNSNEEESEEIDIEDSDYDAVANSAMYVKRRIDIDQNVLIIQPYIKWGPKKANTNPDLQLQEAEALVRSIPQWNVALSLKVPLESLDKKQLFGKGKLEELKVLINKYRQTEKISCMFISKGSLSFAQKRFLEAELGLPTMDRYSVVIQILRLHATSAESKLQVAMAEIPYIWAQMKDANLSSARKQGFYLNDLQKEMLRKRERKLKFELEKIRSQRKLLRNKRKQKSFPIVAIVGYTNAGKTSLIKALTDEQTMQPRNQLFATLDVTAHAGFLPCNLEVIYMDTVGFMSDIPTGLIECFVATLEDAMLADIIVHVQDLSHENYLEQKKHVEVTLKSLILEAEDSKIDLAKVINVGNKIDLVENLPSNLETESMKLISSKTLVGINDLLDEIESKVLKATDRKKLIIKVKSGGEEMAWLYKNAAVTSSYADPENEQNILIEVVISDSIMQQFKHYFC